MRSIPLFVHMSGGRPANPASPRHDPVFLALLCKYRAAGAEPRENIGGGARSNLAQRQEKVFRADDFDDQAISRPLCSWLREL